MADESRPQAGEGPDEELEEGAEPERPRLPVISLAITALFIVLGGLLLYFVRSEVEYYFAGKAPQVHFVPTPDQPVPRGAPSNVLAEVRVDYTKLCDFWDIEKDPFPPEVSYAFTLQMGLGKRYFLTCVGDGTVRPRLWILRPETEEETRTIHLDATRARLSKTMLATWTEERVPEVHVPGGPGCINDLCRGRLIRFADYAQNPLGGVRKIQDVLLERLEPEFRRLGRTPLDDDDYLLILGEAPSSRWWYVAMLGGVVLLTLTNLFFGLRALRRFLQARRVMEGYIRRMRPAGDDRKKRS
ncbi:MAG: hypothetical protein JXB32_22215 [Deltaproteobacteria bacterium]|nr:hypothetical protein [Deltaproteobacteria bacterium]